MNQDWEVQVLCDGHDEQGHFMSQGVCRTLPNIILRRIHDRFPDEIPEPVDDNLIYDSFDECERVVCWTSSNVVQGDLCLIQAGEYEGLQGYVTAFKGLNTAVIRLLDDIGDDVDSIDGDRRIEVPESDLIIPRYIGGCTCVAMIRNMKTNEARIAITGDSRALIYMPGAQIVDPALIPLDGVRTASGETPTAYLTPQHNVFNMEEIGRLNEEYPGAFQIQDSFLVNPQTSFAIQPTRGFGDHDMHGTGYTHMPEITETFFLEENALVFIASDGVFDDKVWQDAEIVTRIAEMVEAGESGNEIARQLYDETLERSLEGGYVDDISICCYTVPGLGNGDRTERISVVEDLAPAGLFRSASKKSIGLEDASKNRRQTLRRGNNESLIQTLLEEEGESPAVDNAEQPAEEAMIQTDPTVTNLENVEDPNKTMTKNKRKTKGVFSLKAFQRKEKSNWQSKSVKKMGKSGGS